MQFLRVPTRRAESSRTDRGATLVEFALILPVFVMFLLGLITGGFALNEKQQMTHAAREGARYAATVPAGQAFSNSSSWAVNVRELIVERSTGSLKAEDICVSLVQGDKPLTAISYTTTDTPPVVRAATWYSTASGGAACISAQTYLVSTNDNGRRVQVSTRKPATIELGVFGGYDVTLTANATAKSESNK